MKSKEARARLWSELSFLFAEDDGGLPEVRLLDVSREGLTRIFSRLRELAEPLDASQTLWYDEREQDVPIRDVVDAAELVADGRIQGFPVLLRGIRWEGVQLPDLGVFVFPGEIDLFYRMGDAWNEVVLGAFIELVGELQHVAAGTRLALEDEVLAEVKEAFQRSVSEYLSSR
jgi:hypothetical protein